MARLQRWWRRWQALAIWEQRLLLQLLWQLPLLKWRLALAADPAAFLRPNPRAAVVAGVLPANCTPHEFAARCAALVTLAARQPWVAATCLPQAVTLHALLQAHGLPSSLRLGVNRVPDSALAAHAWVELEGVALGAEVTQYTAFTELRHADVSGAGESGRL